MRYSTLMTLKIQIVLILLVITSAIRAQDTLPHFSVKNVGNNRIIIGWVNNYGLVKQISIQSSHDSLKNYKTIMSVTDPNARENGFADTKATTDHMYYRLFVVLDKGQFYFTEAKLPFMDTARIARNTNIQHIKDSLIKANIQPVDIAKRNDFIPSFYVTTSRDGYISINLPDADKKKYHIKFYDDQNNLIFEIHNIKETSLTLDKTNFLSSGWFRFELYNDDKLIEKNKVYLPKEF
jgi:hypothetical protein